MSGSMQQPSACDLEEILVATLAAVEAEGLPALHAAVSRFPQHAGLLRAAVAALGPTGEGAADEPPQPAMSDFEIGEEIGRGAMGIVYVARQIGLDRQVAIKMLPGYLAADVTTVARFRREAQAVARLKHPGIVQVYGFGEAAGQPWLAMELVDGVPLDQVIAAMRATPGQWRTGGQLRTLVARLGNRRCGASSTSAPSEPDPWARDAVTILTGVAAQVADALSYAHTRGIVHRDVKPSNILLRADCSALLLDFGLAHDDLGATLTRTGQIAGTPHYMAPEQTLDASATTPRSDVFSLGVVLYELLTLERPFAAGSETAVLERVRGADPIRPSRLNPSLPRDLEAVLQKALEKEPLARYADAGLFAADLQAALRGESVTARHLGPIRRLWRQARRRPVAATLALSLVLGIPTVTALAATLWAQRPMVALAESTATLEQREQLLARAHSSLARRTPQAAEAALATLADAPPDDLEIGIWRLAAMAQAGRAAEASALAERMDLSAEERSWVQQLIRCYGGDLVTARLAEARLHEPGSALSVWVAAAAVSTRAARDHDGETMRRARGLLLRAHLAAPRPRLLLLKQLVSAAHFLGDTDIARGIAAALHAYGGDSVEALASRGEAELMFDPAAAERTAMAMRATGAPLSHSSLLLAQALRAHGRTDEAMATLAAVAASDQHYGDICYQRAAWCMEDGDLAGAEEGVTIALRENPHSVYAAMGLANVQNRRKDYDAVIATLAPFVESLPHHARLQTNYADALLSKGSLDEALACVDRVIASEPAYEYASVTKAQVLARLGRFAEARQALAAAVQARPESGYLWHKQAMFELDCTALPDRDYATAAIAARRSIGLTKINQPVYWWDFVRVLAAAKRWPEVREECQKLRAELDGATDERSQLIAQKLEAMLQRAAAAK